MRKVEQTVYRIDELPESAGREKAFNWVREDLSQLEQAEITHVLDAVVRELPKWGVTREDLEKAANKVGHCYAFALVDLLIERSHYHGAKRADYVENGLRAIMSEKIDEMIDCAFDCFPDDVVIEHANANEWEFTASGEFYRR